MATVGVVVVVVVMVGMQTNICCPIAGAICWPHHIVNQKLPSLVVTIIEIRSCFLTIKSLKSKIPNEYAVKDVPRTHHRAKANVQSTVSLKILDLCGRRLGNGRSRMLRGRMQMLSGAQGGVHIVN